MTGPTGSGKTTTLYARAPRRSRRPRSTSSPSRTRSRSWSTRSTRSPCSRRSGSTSPRRFATSSGKIPTSSWSARCATPRRPRSRSRPRSPGTWSSRRSTRTTRRPRSRGSSSSASTRSSSSSTLVGVVAQRLVRTVCPHCRVETFLTPDQMTLLGLDVHELAARRGRTRELMVAFGEGCVKCRSTGLARAHRRLRGARGRRQDPQAHRRQGERRRTSLKQARHDGLMTLREAAIKKLAKGQTSFEEVLRVTTEGLSAMSDVVRRAISAPRARPACPSCASSPTRSGARAPSSARRSAGRACSSGPRPAAGADDATARATPVAAIERAARAGETGVARVMLDLHPWLVDARVVRALRDLAATQARGCRSCWSCPSATLPAGARSRRARPRRSPLPDARRARRAARREKLEATALAARGVRARRARPHARRGAPRLPPRARRARRATRRSQRVIAEKRGALRRSACLELVDADVTLDDVGGLEVLKAWLRARVLAFDAGARAFGLAEPRGMLVCGVQGCGKSLVSKATARVLGAAARAARLRRGLRGARRPSTRSTRRRARSRRSRRSSSGSTRSRRASAPRRPTRGTRASSARSSPGCRSGARPSSSRRRRTKSSACRPSSRAAAASTRCSSSTCRRRRSARRSSRVHLARRGRDAAGLPRRGARARSSSTGPAPRSSRWSTARLFRAYAEKQRPHRGAPARGHARARPARHALRGEDPGAPPVGPDPRAPRVGRPANAGPLRRLNATSATERQERHVARRLGCPSRSNPT